MLCTARYGQTALMLAAAKGHLPVVNLLLEVGADSELRDDAGMTAAMIAKAFKRPGITMALKRHAARKHAPQPSSAAHSVRDDEAARDGVEAPRSLRSNMLGLLGF